LKVKTDRNWLWRILDFINPLRDPSITVAIVLTFVVEAGQHDAWYWIIVIALVNWAAVRGVVWLVVNFTFASVFLWRRIWWAIRHPRLAWRIMDAVGHEESVIGGFSNMPEGMLLPEGSTIWNMSPALGASGMHVIGELPAGTEIPMLSMPNGQLAPNLAALAENSGFSPGANSAQGEGEFGHKPVVRYGLYQVSGIYNTPFGRGIEDGGTGVTDQDLELLWSAIQEMIELQRSEAKSEMHYRGHYIFSQQSQFGNEHTHKLLERIRVQLTTDQPKTSKQCTHENVGLIVVLRVEWKRVP
jgi:CRISPR-associated protein Cas7